MSVYYKEIPQYFLTSVESIVNQTYPPSEIVIVKDGKLTYELDQIIENFQLKFPGLFKIVRLQINQGLGEALNIGVKECSYDLIARMDTDDISKPDRFEKTLKQFLDNPELDIVGSLIEEFEEEPNNILACRAVPLAQKDIYNVAKRRNPFNHMTVMYRKQAVIDAGNYQSFLWCEDYYLWVRMIMKCCTMKNINESLVYVRSGKEMFERRGGRRYVISEFNLQRKYLDIGFITWFQFITNIALRGMIRLIPNKLRGFIYIKFLR